MMDDKQIFEYWELFKKLLKSTNRPGVDGVIKWLDESDFKFAPASTKYHNNFRGGLLKHSLDVYYHMYDFKNFLTYFDLQEDTIILTSLLHDVCKVDCYGTEYRNTKNENGEWVKVPYYTWDPVENIGHATKSVMLLYEHGLQFNKTERAIIVNHMGFSGASNQLDVNSISDLFSKCPQSLVLHWADEAATYTQESMDLPQRFREKFVGRNITESLKIKQTQQEVEIDGMKYKLAPQDSVVDDKEIITVFKQNTLGVNVPIKVYAPHGDGLPF